MKKIYYKEGEHINNKKDYIITYLTKDTPTTYFVENNFIQCREGRARTFNDLLLLLKSKFKTATKGDLARILLDKDKRDILGCVPCPQVEQMTFYSREFKCHGHYAHGNIFDRCETIRKGPQWGDLVKWATASKKFELIDDYRLINKEAYSKKAKSLFIQFLEEHNIYDEYMKAFNKRHRYGFDQFIDSNIDEPHEWINYGFTWDSTEQGHGYWYEINRKYKEYCRQHA